MSPIKNRFSLNKRRQLFGVVVVAAVLLASGIAFGFNKKTDVALHTDEAPTHTIGHDDNATTGQANNSQQATTPEGASDIAAQTAGSVSAPTKIASPATSGSGLVATSKNVSSTVSTPTTPPAAYPQAPPSFTLSLAQPSGPGNALGFMINITPTADSTGYSYSMPVLTATPNGLPCNSYDHAIYNSTNSQLNWGWSCNPFGLPGGGSPYGEYPVTFTVTGTNNYDLKTTRSVSGIVVYHADQTGYENRF